MAVSVQINRNVFELSHWLISGSTTWDLTQYNALRSVCLSSLIDFACDHGDAGPTSSSSLSSICQVCGWRKKATAGPKSVWIFFCGASPLLGVSLTHGSHFFFRQKTSLLVPPAPAPALHWGRRGKERILCYDFDRSQVGIILWQMRRSGYSIWNLKLWMSKDDGWWCIIFFSRFIHQYMLISLSICL